MTQQKSSWSLTACLARGSISEVQMSMLEDMRRRIDRVRSAAPLIMPNMIATANMFMARRAREYRIAECELWGIYWMARGRCMICGKLLSFKSGRVDSMQIDHCHRTRRVRGILCGSCNMGLGHFKDDPKTLRIAARYLGAEVSGE